MQALPSASPIAPVAPSAPQPTNASVADAENTGAAPGTSPQAEVPFEKVLASQIDAETLRPDLVLAAANADSAEEPESPLDPLAALGREGSLEAQLLSLVPAAPVPSSPAQQIAGEDAAALAAGLPDMDDPRAGDAAVMDQSRGADATLAAEPIDLREVSVGKGGEHEPLTGNAGASEQPAQTQATQGVQESQRSHPGVRSLEGAAFNPRVIPETVKSPQWGEALGQRVVWMAKENVQVVYLQLDPPNLGPLEVQLRLSNDQANLMFVSAHASVRDAISGSLPKLDELLSAGGVSLGSVSVDTQASSQDPEQRPGSFSPPSQAGQWEIDMQTGEAARPARALVVGLVDTFA